MVSPAQHFNATVELTYGTDFHIESAKINEC